MHRTIASTRLRRIGQKKAHLAPFTISSIALSPVDPTCSGRMVVHCRQRVGGAFQFQQGGGYEYCNSGREWEFHFCARSA